MQTYGRPPESSGISSGELFFRYRIARCLGRGGMGEVYEAFDTRLRRSVALKILTTAVDASQQAELRRLLTEARSLAALQHRNIVTVYDVAEHDGVPYLTMELLRGRTLAAIAKSGEGSTDEKLRWILEIASALATVHRACLVHGDVKPGNVMVTGDGSAVLFDFGIARPADPNVVTFDGQSVRGGMVIGTPRYMAPEVTAGTRASAATDQYAWGVIAAQLLAGKKPNPDADIAQLLFAASIPRLLEAVVLRATDRRPEFRFASMDEIVAALEPLTRAPIHAPKQRMMLPIVVVAGVSVAVGALAGAFSASRSRAVRHEPVERIAPATATGAAKTATATAATATASTTPLVPLATSASDPSANAAPTATATVMQRLTPTSSTAPTISATSTTSATTHECVADADCACGVSKATGLCAVGPVTRIDSTRRCPDYCEGFEGNMITTCNAGRCAKARAPTVAEPQP